MRRALLGLVVVCAGLAGCRHKPAPVTVPAPPQTTIPLIKAPEPATPPLVAQVPLQAPPEPAVKLPKKVYKPKKKPVVPVPATPVVAAPVQVASAGPMPESASVIGALSAGGDAAPEKKQKAGGLIAELDKRLAGLPADVQEKQRDGLVRVRYFEREARAALEAGDGDGAVTLVTKARLLLDDLVK